MGRKHRRSGHYCWACDRMRPNEKFSGRNHSRHLCKDCAKLGKEELAYRQAIRDLERLMTWEGIIPRKRRRQIGKFLDHEDERVQSYAWQLVEADAMERAGLHMDECVDEFMLEWAAEEYTNPPLVDAEPEANLDFGDIPF